MIDPLYLAQFRFDPRALLAHARLRGRNQRAGDLGYVTHMVLKELFGSQAPRPFRIKTTGEIFTVLGYSRHDHQTLLATARAVAEPDVFGLWHHEGPFTKQLPEWRAGQPFGFELWAVPSRRIGHRTATQGDERLRALKDERATYEVDAWVAERLRLGADAPSREETYRRWLVEQVARLGGATLERVELDAHRERFARRGKPVDEAARSELPRVLYRGRLCITDPTAFHALIARGIGRHRAFGLGMVLLRPA
ncbi:MAG: type I-E CRISPR-associated protein Cas6/Cse3/CasE [Myxococcales bacterium]|nr:type I-E CRISPR-associated protein Cas6/Cse3/CasE [Myxococcales bacterium]